MSVRWTVALFGQFWHFMPSASAFAEHAARGRRGSRRSRSNGNSLGRGCCSVLAHPLRTSRFFKLTNPVPEARRLFIRFSVDRLLQLLTELDQLRLCLLVLRQPPRRLAAVACLAVNVFQQG